MRAPMMPGKKPEDNDQREAMLRRLGIAEEKPRTPSRWDVLARDLEPAPPIQTPPPVVDEAPVEEALPTHQPIPMTTEALRTYETPEPAAPAPEAVVIQAPIQPVVREPEPAPEPVAVETPVIEATVIEAPVVEASVVEAPVARAPEPQPQSSMNGASFMPGWGEESIPEDEEVEAFDEPEAPVEAAAPVDAVVHQPRWMDEPVAEAPRREELLPKMERPVSFTPSVAPIANDEDLDLPVPEAEAEAEAEEEVEAEAEAPIMEARVELEPVVDLPVARAPVVEPAAPAEPVVARQPETPPAPEPVVEAPVVRDPFTPPAPEPVAETPVVEPEPAPEPVLRQPKPEPVVEAPVARSAAPEPQPAPTAPAADTALQEMRAELEAMRKQFQTAPQPQPQPQPAMPIAAAIPYDGRRRKGNQDFFANARMVVWTLGIVAALWVSFHALKASSHHQAREDHIMASVTGKDKVDDTSDKADQNNDN